MRVGHHRFLTNNLRGLPTIDRKKGSKNAKTINVNAKTIGKTVMLTAFAAKRSFARLNAIGLYNHHSSM